MQLKYHSKDFDIDIPLEASIAAKRLSIGQIPYGFACIGGYAGPTPCYLLCVHLGNSEIYLTVEFCNIEQSVLGRFQSLVSQSKKENFPHDVSVHQGGRIAA